MGWAQTSLRRPATIFDEQLKVDVLALGVRLNRVISWLRAKRASLMCTFSVLGCLQRAQPQRASVTDGAVFDVTRSTAKRECVIKPDVSLAAGCQTVRDCRPPAGH